MNLLLFFVVMLLSLGLVFFAFRYSLTTLYVAICVLYVITNITAGKIAIIDFYLFSVPVSCAAPLYASIFLATDMIAECFTSKKAFRAVWIGFASQICLLVIGYLIKLIKPVEGNFLAEPLDVIFSYTPRLIIGSLIAYIVSQNFDILMYDFLRRLHGRKFLWLRNNASTILSQLIDSFLVFSIAFAGVIENWIAVMISTYVVKVIVAMCDTPWIYLARRFGSLNKDITK